jgi:hypothetical protein
MHPIAYHHKTRQDKTSQDTTRQDKTRQDNHKIITKKDRIIDEIRQEGRGGEGGGTEAG